ncbi:MAG: MGMT family protein [Candidatus Moranbacteria bacterium]|nr:MGMT family protein [Candidatus Moranbacteria bacterium]
MITFSERVIRIARSIPKGRVTTYGRIAKAAGGGTLASRSITGILGKAWENGIKDIPFHRIVYANGRIWSNAKYHKERLRLYKKEGIDIDKQNRIKNFSNILFEFR